MNEIDWTEAILWFFAALGGRLFFYIAYAGSYHYFLNRKAHRWFHRIQSERAKASAIAHEVRWSITTVVLFSFFTPLLAWAISEGYTAVYFEVDDYGVPYLVASVVILLVVHDAYFYWIHRLLHQPWLYRNVHYLHHRATNPTSFSALSFHPVEALLEGGIIPIAIFVLPLHPVAFVAWFGLMLAVNIEGHSGFEFRKLGFRQSSWGRWFGGSSLHNHHHRRFHGNYGLYTMIWDRWRGTYVQPEDDRRLTVQDRDVARP